MSDSTATEILDTLMKNLKEILSTKTIVGEPVQAGSMTILPVMKVSLGFGAGTGPLSKPDGKSSGGGGGGLSISPVGFLIIEDGRAMMLTPQSSRWDWVIDGIPEMVEKLTKIRRGAKAGKQEAGGEPSASST
ncbi:sporulation protein [candidate division KSB1 bacterium]|nr:sporulation protein [candidate division KSB1 bacterium]